MNSRDIQPNQAEQIRRTLQPKIAYILKLKNRMENVGFPPNDPLLVRVRAAYDAMHTLYIDLHYA